MKKCWNTPQEGEYIAKWLEGKTPQKPKDNSPKNIIYENKWQIFLNIQQTINIFISQENNNQKLLGIEKEKNKDLTQQLASRDKTITDLQNELKKAVSNKELAEAQLINEQTKNQQLELLLKAEKAKVATLIKQKSEKFSEDNQLIAQIEIPNKK